MSLSVDRPLKVLYLEETHDPSRNDMCRHAMCSASSANKSAWKGRKRLILGGFGMAGWTRNSCWYPQSINSTWQVAGAQ